MEIWLVILLVIAAAAIAAIAAAVGWFAAMPRGRTAGVQAERTRQQGILAGAEEQAARIVADAETNVKAQQLALREEEVRQRTESDMELGRRRKETAHRCKASNRLRDS